MVGVELDKQVRGLGEIVEEQIYIYMEVYYIKK